MTLEIRTSSGVREFRPMIQDLRRGDQCQRIGVERGTAELPADFLNCVKCSANMRYGKTPQPYLETLKSHHTSIRLGALIARKAPAIQEMGDSLSISTKALSRDMSLEMARAVQALNPRITTWPRVKLVHTE